jgi:hypothetical protein
MKNQKRFEAFVEAYKKHNSIKLAAKDAGIVQRTAYEWLWKYKALNGQTSFYPTAKKKSVGRKHFVIPDVQVKPGQDFTFLRHVGQFIVETQPDVIIQIGDFADMESLSSYDRGKASAEGKRIQKDLEAVHLAMEALLGPIWEYNEYLKSQGLPEYRPRFVITLGNHEERIARACNDNPALEGFLSYDCLKYKEYGWDVIPYLKPEFIDGVAYAHYFTSGVMGRPIGNARMLVQKKMMSCVQGHVQNAEIHSMVRVDGKMIYGLFSGCCYEHDEGYLGPQGNHYFRGVWVLHEVDNGYFEPMQVSLRYLRNKYE